MLTQKEKFDRLRSIGFSYTPDCDVLIAFHAPSLAFDSRMSIQGDNEDEQAYVYYCHTSQGDGDLDGFFHAPTLLERMLQCYPDEWDVERMLAKLNDALGDEVKLVHVGGLPMLYLELSYYDFEIDHFASALSTMCKLIGQLDYILPRIERRILAKRGQNQDGD